MIITEIGGKAAVEDKIAKATIYLEYLSNGWFKWCFL